MEFLTTIEEESKLDMPVRLGACFPEKYRRNILIIDFGKQNSTFHLLSRMYMKLNLDTIFVKTAATPTFCKRNFHMIIHIGETNIVG